MASDVAEAARLWEGQRAGFLAGEAIPRCPACGAPVLASAMVAVCTRCHGGLSLHPERPDVEPGDWEDGS